MIKMEDTMKARFILPKPLNSKIITLAGKDYLKQDSGGFFIDINFEKTYCLCGASIDDMCSFFGAAECDKFYPSCRKENIYFKEVLSNKPVLKVPTK